MADLCKTNLLQFILRACYYSSITILLIFNYLIFLAQENRYDICCCIKQPTKEALEKSEGILYILMNEYYSHFLLKEWVRPIVVSEERYIAVREGC